MQTSAFDREELLCRAVWPSYVKHNGRLSDAAFKEEKGLSVDRQAKRTKEECVMFMKVNRHLHGGVYAVTYSDCQKVEALVLELPTRDDKYHCEIHGSETEAMLQDEQAMMLSLVARCLCEDMNRV